MSTGKSWLPAIFRPASASRAVAIPPPAARRLRGASGAASGRAGSKRPVDPAAALRAGRAGGNGAVDGVRQSAVPPAGNRRHG
jgi:hypothetical protein